MTSPADLPFSAFTAASIAERSEAELRGRLRYLDSTALPAAKRGGRSDGWALAEERLRIRDRLDELADAPN